jgi:hypothetical protein
MIVEFRCDIERPRFWMSRPALSDEFSTQIAWTETGTPPLAGLEALFELERILLRKGVTCFVDTLKDAGKKPRRTDRTPDVVVDFTSASRDPLCRAPLYLRPLYNGAAGEDAALAAILAGDLPVIEIVKEPDGAVLNRGLPSSEVSVGLSGALDTVIARTMTLLRKVLSGKSGTLPAVTYRPSAVVRNPVSYVLGSMARSIMMEIYRLCCYAPHWHVGWRYTDDAGVWKSGNLSGPRWQTIPDPGHRFYADPFPVTWGGKTCVFVEDLDHRVGKGIISAVEFDGAGPKGEVFPVLEEPWHLSYPFLIEHDDDLWMIPESSQCRDVALYKCVRFPDKWERHSALLSGFELSDATITRHNGMNYLFGAWRDGAGGYSDTLAIFYAKDLLGPWLPHASNPIIVDRTSARPAGNFVTIDGKLWRPVQNCTDGYGAALGLAEIVELTPTTFRQTIRHSIRPGPLWPGRKLHTLNRCGRLEVIDGTRIQPKFAFPLSKRRSVRNPPRATQEIVQTLPDALDIQRGGPFL